MPGVIGRCGLNSDEQETQLIVKRVLIALYSGGCAVFSLDAPRTSWSLLRDSLPTCILH